MDQNDKLRLVTGDGSWHTAGAALHALKTLARFRPQMGLHLRNGRKLLQTGGICANM